MAFDFKKLCKKELNVGLKDQQIRYWAGGAALLLSVFLGNVFLLIVGVILVGSAYLRWCPAYSALGKNTVEAGGAPPAAEEAAPAETSAAEPEKAAPARKPRASRAKKE